MADLERLLSERLAPAFEAVALAPADPVVRRSQHADFQADGALAVARRLGRRPRDVAEEVVARADVSDLCSAVEVAGPGFINLTVADEALGRLAAEVAGDERLGVAPAGAPEIAVIDYSAPNAAKEMHVGHMRSTIIGDAAVRVLEWLGHTVIRQNHIGDWGTPYGMLIEHLVDIGVEEAASELSVGELGEFYREARRKFDADEAFRERARRRVVLLQRGDPATMRLWQEHTEQTKRYFMSVYARLGVRLTADDFTGESFYHDRLPSTIDELAELGLLRESEGARCVFPAGFTNREGEPLPLIVQKRDEGFGYDSADLAAVRYRLRELEATRLLYVVGLPQRQHLEMVFEVAREAGWLEPPARAEHVGHGAVLGTDGKIMASRAGASFKLVDLLDEAVARAGALVDEKNPGLDEDARGAIARAVGIGAVKYGDLSTDRTKDYVFDWDRMLAFDGNTAPYLQYAHARICSIFRRAGAEAPEGDGPVLIREPAERALVMELLRFGAVVPEVAESLRFHHLAVHLYAVGTAFTAFYERCPVLTAPADLRRSRLVLCGLTARILERGLGLLGIDAPDQM